MLAERRKCMTESDKITPKCSTKSSPNNSRAMADPASRSAASDNVRGNARTAACFDFAIGGWYSEHAQEL